MIRDNKGITTTEMAEHLAVTRRTVQRVLDDLKDKGGRRYGYWEIVDSAE